LWGLDINEKAASENSHIKVCNVAIEKIPFEDDFFDSVSAYDFIEHLPRALINDGQTRYPFVELMDEIWRVLKPRGLLYAVTPAYPRQEAFVDPTHTNVITAKTHEYFTSPHYLARIYGFEGHFVARRVQWVRRMQDYEICNPSLWKRIKRYKYFLQKKMTHLMWEFEKIPSQTRTI
jgi:SAM-dependent methyltransferase